MNRIFLSRGISRRLAGIWMLFMLSVPVFAMVSTDTEAGLTAGEGTVTLKFENGSVRRLCFYADNVFRMFQDGQGGPFRDPDARPEARILADHPCKEAGKVEAVAGGDCYVVTSARLQVRFGKADGRMTVKDLATGRVVLAEAEPASVGPKESVLTLRENPDEWFYGGGVQNGRFSHKGQVINIVNENSWTDGGVCSPCPWYWSTAGYAILFHTFAPGTYDFGAGHKGRVRLTHRTDRIDCFVMVDDGAAALLRAYYRLTGHPVLLPKFGFYEGHLNAYNRDYWKETDRGGIVFEDGKRYVESQKDNGGIRETLNGEKGNYQFSARAVIDRYEAHDMPLGWILPNDGYGAGYGQTSTLDGNIGNLKEFGDYARKKGVEIGLWTQSDLHPVDTIPALLQRDMVKEIGVSGVRLLKTDVAWVGAGYSFGLNGIADAAGMMTRYGNNARPFIITLDGWAGTQRYAGVWTGDQTGGKWEYIRFHIPTYIGAGLAGMPNITSDMDGIFGGKDPVVNIRDFQWKTFTPMQLNMDGWGSNEKYPHAMGEPATSINRNYLKLKSALLPYFYSVAHTAVDSLPMMRAMFLEEPNKYTLGTATRYQFMAGPWFLVAPVYQATAADAQGNDVRNGIYLPKGRWIDYYNGNVYEGGAILNNFAAPVWKLPLFVKAGAIIPMTAPNNHPDEIDKHLRIYELYPDGDSEFTVYDDDGRTQAYLTGEGETTHLSCSVKKDVVTFCIDATKGRFEGMEKERCTLLRVNVTRPLKSIKVKVGKRNVKLQRAVSREDFDKARAAYYYDAAPELNLFSTPGSDASRVAVKKNPQMLVKIPSIDVTKAGIVVTMKGYGFDKSNPLARQTGNLAVPAGAEVAGDNRKPYSLVASWEKVAGADYYEMLYDSMVYTGIRQNSFEFTDLQPDTEYGFRVRAVNRDGHSDWAAFKARTSEDPLEFAIKGITASCTAADQPGNGIRKLFDWDEQNMWHTKWETQAIPFEMIIDLHSVNTLDKIVYIPRQIGANGIITSGSVAYSMDKDKWTEAGRIEWAMDASHKTFVFQKHPVARYLRIKVEKGYGGFGSGQELYVFRAKGTPAYIPGDINNDGQLDDNDLTSYMNYTGLRKGDKDFEGYVSKGDINGNGLIDAYDISNVAVELDGGARPKADESVAGRLLLVPDKRMYKAGETAEITVRGLGLQAVNAMSFSLAYAPSEYEFVAIRPIALKEMRNFTNDRLHSNGQKSLYPTFVNVGNKPLLDGTGDLFIMRFKVKKAGAFVPRMADGILVDRNLQKAEF